MKLKIRYRHLREKGLSDDEIAVNLIPGTSNIVYDIQDKLQKKKEKKLAESAAAAAGTDIDSYSAVRKDLYNTFNAASAMKELKEMTNVPNSSSESDLYADETDDEPRSPFIKRPPEDDDLSDD